jgi:diadenosine tetraphosphate (Ap4A) HIT family hydrolase
MKLQWPGNWDRLISGKDCTFCTARGQDRNQWGARIHLGKYSDAYLQSADVQRGYTLVIWKGRHIVEPVELSDDESAGYWLETMQVARVLMAYYQPLKMNYETLGNTSPHLHTHLVPRYVEDPRPGQPFPLQAQEGVAPQIAEEDFVEQVKALRVMLL